MATVWWFFSLVVLILLSQNADSQHAAVSETEIRTELFGLQRSPDPNTGPSLLQEMSSEVPAKKSVGLAAVYSLLLPGMGELYAGGFGSGKYFLLAEGILWLSYAAIDIHAGSQREDARVYSTVHAAVDRSGKDDQFFVNVGNFASVDDYNDKKLRDREPDLVYDPAAGYNWRWDSEASRLTFRDQRVASENMYNNRKFVGAAILVNHVASAINAARAAIAHNSALDEALGDLRFDARILGGWEGAHGVMLTVTRGF
jgi:TM2 domain-containing membrane protein YozV